MNQLSTYSTNAKGQLQHWFAKLKMAKEKLKKKLEKSIYIEKMLTSDIAANKLLAEAFDVSQKLLQNEIAYINATMDEINRLLEDNYLAVFMKELIQVSFNSFSDSEFQNCASSF